MVKGRTEHQASGLLDRMRFRLLKFLYDRFSIVMVRDQSWQESLVTSLSPEPKNQILDFGPGSSSTAIALAHRYPEAIFIGADPDPKAVDKARQSVVRDHTANIAIIESPLHRRLPFDAGSFDKAVCVLTFHDCLPDAKLVIAKEMMRVLRRGGTLHVADYDRPDTSSEQAILKLTRYISGAAAAEPHVTGMWTEYLKKAGFSGIRRQSSHSVGVGRISVVRAQKR